MRLRHRLVCGGRLQAAVRQKRRLRQRWPRRDSRGTTARRLFRDLLEVVPYKRIRCHFPKSDWRATDIKSQLKRLMLVVIAFQLTILIPRWQFYFPFRLVISIKSLYTSTSYDDDSKWFIVAIIKKREVLGVKQL